MKCKKEKDWVSSLSHLPNENKFIRKVRKRRHWNPLFGHRGDEISKNRKKKGILGFKAYETQFSSKFGAKLSLPCPFFS
jgi:hypothetical protein